MKNKFQPKQRKQILKFYQFFHSCKNFVVDFRIRDTIKQRFVFFNCLSLIKQKNVMKPIHKK